MQCCLRRCLVIRTQEAAITAVTFDGDLSPLLDDSLQSPLLATIPWLFRNLLCSSFLAPAPKQVLLFLNIFFSPEQPGLQ